MSNILQPDNESIIRQLKKVGVIAIIFGIGQLILSIGNIWVGYSIPKISLPDPYGGLFYFGISIILGVLLIIKGNRIKKLKHIKHNLISVIILIILLTSINLNAKINAGKSIDYYSSVISIVYLIWLGFLFKKTSDLPAIKKDNLDNSQK